MSKLRSRQPQDTHESAARERERASVGHTSSSLRPPCSVEHAPTSLGTVSLYPSPSHERIAERAYQLWEANGRPSGTDRTDWFEAERLLRTQA